MNIILNSKDFTKPTDKYHDAPHASSGQVYDLLGIAAGCGEYNDIKNFEAHDATIDYAVREYDYEAGYIEALNAAPSYEAMADLLGCDAGEVWPSDCWKVWQKSDLRLAAFIALNFTKLFADGLADWTAKVKEAATEYLNEPAIIPADLLKAINDSVDSTDEQEMKEWLNGDYRNWRGVYDEASRRLFKDYDSATFTGTDELRRKNAVMFTIDEEDAKTFIEDMEGIDALTLKRVPSMKRVKEAVIVRILNRAEEITAKEKREREARTMERQEQADREASRAKAEAEARKA